MSILDSRSPDRSGFLIVFEGIDGVGKSTQVKRLGAELEKLGHTVHLRKEPTDGPHGARLRASAETGRLSPEEELGLFLKDRQQHVSEVILPALEAGEFVILDRYYFSTMAYQGQRGFDVEEIRRDNEAFAPQPDLLIILELPVEESLRRIGGRGDTANEFEQREGLEACKALFDQLGDDFIARIDCRQSIDEVAAEVWGTVRERLIEAGEI